MSKIKYVDDNMRVNPIKVIFTALFKLDLRRTMIIVGHKKNGELYVASSDSGKNANSVLTKAIRFLKIG